MSRPQRPAIMQAILAIAGSTAALAVPPGAKDLAAGDDAMPAAMARAFRLPAGALSRARPAGQPLDLSGAFGAIARGSAGADVAISTMDTGFESLAPLPADLVGQLDTVAWGGAAASVTGRNVFGAPTAPLAIPQYGVVADPVAGNSTQKLRGFVQPAFGVNAFFGRWCRYNLVRVNGVGAVPATSFAFAPAPNHDLRIIHDTYVNSINSLWTSEPTYVSSGFVIVRLLWGGQNATSGIGLPVGPITDFYTLNPDPCGPIFPCVPFAPCLTPAFYRSGEPLPGGAGHTVPVPVNSWFSIIHETTTDGFFRHVLDLHDGHGEFVIFEALIANGAPGRLDRMAFAGGFETLGDACYIDNLHIDGVQYLSCLRPQGDVTFDGVIDFADLNIVLSQFGQTAPNLTGDVNNDGVVNFADLNILLSNYGATC